MAKAIERSHPTLVNWEHGKTNISKADLALLLTELEAPTGVRESLEQLRRESRQQGWWSTYKLPDWLRPLVSFEEDAERITSFEPIVVPGLLQTQAYARAVQGTNRSLPVAADVDKWVALRMDRQRRLFGQNPLKFDVVIAEAALRLEVDGSEVMAEQLWHLVRVASAPNVRMRVLPYRAGAHSGVSSNFSVLHFADPKFDPPLGYLDDVLGGHVIDDQQDVGVLTDMFEEVSGLALAAPESVDFIAEVMEEYRSKRPKKGRRKGNSDA